MDLTFAFAYSNTFFIGILNNLKRNNVKLHDNVLVLLQDNAQSKKERKMLMKIISDLREEIRILVS